MHAPAAGHHELRAQRGEGGEVEISVGVERTRGVGVLGWEQAAGADHRAASVKDDEVVAERVEAFDVASRYRGAEHRTPVFASAVGDDGRGRPYAHSRS
jgi:hypothetical protein